MYIIKTASDKFCHSFLVRFFVFLLCIILVFNAACKPQKVHAAALGTVTTWGLVEYLAALVTSAGLAITVNEFLDALGVYSGSDDAVSEDDALKWCKKNISVDGNDNIVFTDNAKAFISNYLLGTYNDSVTMTYKYVVNPDNLDYSIFDHKAAYEELYKFIKSHPQYYFKGCVKANERWGSSCIWLQAFVFDSAVSANYNLSTASCSIYDDDWKSPVVSFQIGINDIESDDGKYWAYSPINSPANTQTGKTAAEIDKLLADNGIGSTAHQSSGVLVTSRSFKTTLISNCIFSFNDAAINCYKSVADMKKDTANQVVGTYTPDYTGTPNYNITTSEVNNVVNNYYSGGSSGDDSGGSSGSGDSGGSSGILDGIGKVFGAIGKVIDTVIGFVLDIVAKLIEGISKILDSFANVFTRLIDLVPSGFNDFLTAMFPYVPEEWVSLVSAMITIFALGAIFWFFKGR